MSNPRETAITNRPPGDRPDTPPATVQPITRALAELQMRIVSEGLRAFDGWLERFIVYTLVARLSGLAEPGSITPISANALAASLGLPYETARRHVNALVADGLCVRSRTRVLATREGLARPHIAHLIAQTHDALVRFIEDLAAIGEALPETRAEIAYRPAYGVQLAADIMLAVIATNRDAHARWIDLVLFSTVVAANCRAAPFGHGPHIASVPVSAIAVARGIGLRPATVGRHLMAMTRTGQLRRTGEGYLLNDEWLSHPGAQAVTRESLAHIRRLLRGLAGRGFPFDDPATAYLDQRPARVPIG